MDSAQEERQKQGGFLDAFNNFVGSLPNFFGKGSILKKAGIKAAGGALTLIPFWAWIVLGIAILAGIVFIIVVSGVAPGGPPQNTTMPTPAP